MSGLPFVAPLLVLVSALWSVAPLLCPHRRRPGVVVALLHLVATAAILRPWDPERYAGDGVWMVLVFGQGALVALGRLAFEASPLGARAARRA